MPYPLQSKIDDILAKPPLNITQLKMHQRRGDILTRAQKDQIKKFDEKQRKKNLTKKKK